MKHKPKTKFKALTAYWWNPLFWMVVIATPFFHATRAFVVAIKEVIDEVKHYDLR